ncbi:hypothetical protein [Bacillus cereus]
MANTDTAPTWMWQVGDDDGVNIAEGTLYVINKDVTVHVRDGQNLYIGGELWDDDDISADDYMSRPGGNWAVIPLNEITPFVKYYEIWFQESDQKIRVDYQVIEEQL